LATSPVPPEWDELMGSIQVAGSVEAAPEPLFARAARTHHQYDDIPWVAALEGASVDRAAKAGDFDA